MDLKKLIPNAKAFTALLVGSILAIMIGAVLIIITYTIINPIFTTAAAAMVANSSMNASLYGNLSNITSALNIGGIMLIVVGISGIVYMLIGLGGGASGNRK
jgi:hypothetical protein